MNRTIEARLAVIEEIVMRTETKLDDHIEKTDRRLSRLERAWAWAAGALSLAALYVKTAWVK